MSDNLAGAPPQKRILTRLEIAAVYTHLAAFGAYFIASFALSSAVAGAFKAPRQIKLSYFDYSFVHATPR